MLAVVAMISCARRSASLASFGGRGIGGSIVVNARAAVYNRPTMNAETPSGARFTKLLNGKMMAAFVLDRVLPVRGTRDNQLVASLDPNVLQVLGE